MDQSNDSPTILSCSRCGMQYRGYPPRWMGSAICPACELHEILTDRPTPEEDDLERVCAAHKPTSPVDGATTATLYPGLLVSPDICALLSLPSGTVPDVTFYWGDGFLNPSDAARWRSYRAELLHVAPSAFGRPHPWVEPLLPNTEPRALLRWRVWAVDAPGVLQVWYDTDLGRERRRADDFDLDVLGRLEAFLTAVRNSRRRGRPVGSGVPTSEQFRERLAAAYHACAVRSLHRPTQLEVAAEMGLGYTTFRERLQRHGIDWREYSKAQRSAN